MNNCKSHDKIRSRIDRKMEITFTLREMDLRIYHSNESAGSPGALQVRNQVNIGRLCVRAPNQNHFGLHVIFKRDAGHLSIHAGSCCGARSSTNSTSEAGGPGLSKKGPTPCLPPH